MLEIALMIEGLNGLTWPHWQRIVCLAEDLGFMGLFQSDHFTNPTRPISTRWNYGRRLPADFAQLNNRLNEILVPRSAIPVR